MTFQETASAMRRVADGIEKIAKDFKHDPDNGKPKPMLEGEAGAGAAVMLCYLRDLITASSHEQWDRGTLLVLLETMSRDAEVFPCGVGELIWQAEDDAD